MVNLIIDANGAIFGRLCSFAAKIALEGNEIAIINSEKTLITGNKNDIVKHYKMLREIGGHALSFPKHSRLPEKKLAFVQTLTIC